jgi:hypothetical protein
VLYPVDQYQGFPKRQPSRDPVPTIGAAAVELEVNAPFGAPANIPGHRHCFAPE